MDERLFRPRHGPTTPRAAEPPAWQGRLVARYENSMCSDASPAAISCMDRGYGVVGLIGLPSCQCPHPGRVARAADRPATVSATPRVASPSVRQGCAVAQRSPSRPMRSPAARPAVPGGETGCSQSNAQSRSRKPWRTHPSKLWIYTSSQQRAARRRSRASRSQSRAGTWGWPGISGPHTHQAKEP